jgi:Glycosyl hydrolase family 79 C-terminal beta domain
MGTKPPYYGNVAVAAMIGESTMSSVSIVNIPLSHEQEAAYAAYVNGKLARIMVVSLEAYNYTLSGLGAGLNPVPRPTYSYTFQLPPGGASEVAVQRLYANGSDALSGITFDGWSFNYELAQGRPVRLQNITTGETLPVTAGKVTVVVQASQAVILNLVAEPGS